PLSPRGERHHAPDHARRDGHQHHRAPRADVPAPLCCGGRRAWAPAAMRCITLTTDFGLADPFVGVMKGVIAGRAPGCTAIDLTHAIPPQDVMAGPPPLPH